MNREQLESCLTLIATGYKMANRERYWKDEQLVSLYDTLLTRFDGDGEAVFVAIKEFILYEDRAPTTAELSVLLRRCAPIPVTQKLSDGEYASPDEAYRMLKAGFMSNYAITHPGKPLPAEWEQTFRRIEKRLSDNQTGGGAAADDLTGQLARNFERQGYAPENAAKLAARQAANDPFAEEKT